MPLLSYVIAAALTSIIEVLVVFFLGRRQLSFLTAVLAINLLTNPLLNWIYALLSYFALAGFPAILVLEAVVILIEWKLLEYSTAQKSLSLLLLSAIMNAASFSVGLLFF